MKAAQSEVWVFRGVRLITYSIVLIVGYLFFDILWKGNSTFSWEFLTGLPRRSGAEGGIYPDIMGTIYLVLGAIMVALRMGIASAIFLSEYAPQGRLNRTIRLAIITLAGVPSIVFGLFGLVCSFCFSVLVHRFFRVA